MSRKSNRENSMQGGYVQGNRFFVSDRDMQSPYMQSYSAALQTGPLLGSPYDNQYSGRYVAADVGSPQKVKRNIFVIITAILLIVLVAFFVLSYLEIKSIAGYTAFAKKGTEPVKTISLKNVVDGVLSSFKKDPAEELDGKGRIYFNDQIVESKDLKMLDKVVAYGLPASIVLFALILLIFLVRVIISVFTQKQRKFFVLSSLVLLILGVLINAMFFLWNADFKVAQILDFFKGAFIENTSDIAVTAAIGAIVVIGVPLIALITSIFCFRRKAKY